jgi:type IV pilus assembly protein PilE
VNTPAKEDTMNAGISARRCRSRVKARGFSLIELLIAMVIVAILASIAIPSYNTYILRSHRTDAKSALLDLASLEERYFSAFNGYTDIPNNLGYTGAVAGVPFPVGLNGYYQVTVTQTAAIAPTAGNNGTPATYTIVAQAIGTQVNDTQCLTFTLTSAGLQTATPDPQNNCWSK